MPAKHTQHTAALTTSQI